MIKTKRYIFLALLIFLTTFNPELPLLKLGFFIIKTVNVSGSKNTDLEKIKKQFNFLVNTSILSVDNKKMNEIISQNEWIHFVNINKKFPSTINIVIVEHEPFVFWKKGNNNLIITKEFTLIEKFSFNNFSNQTQAKGNFDIEDLKKLYKALNNNNFDLSSITSFEFINSERWDLFLKGNKKIMLGRHDYNQQISNLNKVLIQSKDEKFTYIDLRLKNKIFVK
ncbi:MAG: FtsQ-type POTRA domain-containing protein [Candidatus Fonsibacter lacus]|jgi:cell division septal protein FtsQ|uniref:FtsQ-type POTRA domain-containing protein n=1 Tax=Candidatus Fonsibacter lacus TaxID=2576439 RepID=A0A845SAJ6_9PROT|nr:FtsQ-type POTRA domain-containing protein [Candidatus Fonsibacter lacus]NDB48834.1 FtsQ-type POTRA domain-containing protein [Pseudomonadota bacterium]NCU48722.1 FtsQ-type POTRA domain-containing protein [Candidatus Fonsibacter lacus]NCU53076.1 FtsQ-type POTRA domain-containing protein [Candidatus Fonsibacter lacus]NCU63014.1 FtsQ-type POTRA domain-containing protein [Candidatus Fonsibacter lacus]